MHATHVAGLGLPISQAALGTMTFGDSVDATGAAAMVDTALEAGITVVDTANVYSGGRCEELLAPLLSTRRDSVILATKAGIPHEDGGGLPPLSRVALRRSVHGSLRRLGVERIDLFYLHQPDRATPLHETLGTIHELMNDGLIGAFGVSNYAAWQIGELNHVAASIGMSGPAVAQQLCNLVARRVEEEYFEFARVSGLFTMVYNPLAGGLLTGRHTFTVAPTEGRFAHSDLADTYRDRYWDARMFTAVDSLAAIAAGAGVSLAELALRWLTGLADVASILLGASRDEQLRANIGAITRGPLPPDVLSACDDVAITLRGPMPSYNR